MDAKKENRLNMYLVLKQYLDNVPAGTIDSMPEFGNYFTQFNDNTRLIEEKSEQQSGNRQGYRLDKTAGKEETVLYAINMAKCITAFASNQHNTVLENLMKFTKSELMRKRDTATAIDAKFIRSKGIEHLANLSHYGITQAEIDTLTAAIDNFETNIPLPKMSRNQIKYLMVEIEALFKENDTLLKEMDKLADIKMLTDKQFYTNYFYARKIVNYHGPKLALRGFITDTQGNPIPSVEVTIPEFDLATKSTERGYYEFKNLPKGIQNVIFKRVDFETESRLVGIISGQRVQLNIVLENTNSNQDVA